MRSIERDLAETAQDVAECDGGVRWEGWFSNSKFIWQGQKTFRRGTVDRDGGLFIEGGRGSLSGLERCKSAQLVHREFAFDIIRVTVLHSTTLLHHHSPSLRAIVRCPSLVQFTHSMIHPTNEDSNTSAT